MVLNVFDMRLEFFGVDLVFIKPFWTKLDIKTPALVRYKSIFMLVVRWSIQDITRRNDLLRI